MTEPAVNKTLTMFALKRTGKEPLSITRAQWDAIKRKYGQNPDGKTLQEFCNSVQPAMDGLIMVPWCGMWLGIERDGYTHS
jgi:hypothetical protein